MTALPPLSRRLAALAMLLPSLPATALAATATASQNLNVRSGPATSYGVLTQLPQGTSVDVRQCEGDFCQIVAGSTTGWVSATYLTRDLVAKPAASAPVIIAATRPTPANPTSSVTVTSTNTTATPRATAPSEQIASTMPPALRTRSTRALPSGTFPPAYDGSASDQADDDPAYADGEDARSMADLPDDSGAMIAGTDPNVPRPQADVPNGSRIGPDDEFADGSETTPPADIPEDSQQAYAPRDDWRYGPGFGYHRGYGGDRPSTLAIGDHIGRACFFEAPGAGAGGFCVREGETAANLGDWSDRLVAMRNPEGLRVTICMDGALRDCRVFDQSGPLDLPGNLPIDSIRVSAPRD